MHPCVRCAKKGNCPDRCKPKADYIRHMKRLNRKIRKEAKNGSNQQTERDAAGGDLLLA